MLPATTFHQPSDAVDLGEVGSLLRRRLGLIAFFVLGMTLCAVLYVMFATPQFTARGALYLGDAPTTGGGGGGDDGGGMNLLTAYSNQSDVETQIELITAGTLVQNAVLETGLNTQMTPADDVLALEVSLRRADQRVSAGPDHAAGVVRVDARQLSGRAGQERDLYAVRALDLVQEAQGCAAGRSGQPGIRRRRANAA
jgi:uncharacterized protein involved in exopolysaccharide biosynthesis